MSHFLTELDLPTGAVNRLLADAVRLKAERKGGQRSADLEGQTVALYFEKPSVRTRVSFTIGVQELGGQVVELSPSTTKVGKGEEPADFAKVLGRYVHAIVARVFDQSLLETFAQHAGVPVINALSDERHPCQALADALTIQERLGRIEGAVFAFVGEGNNVAASTGLLLAALGADVRVASPEDYGLPASILYRGRGLAGSIRQTTSVEEAVEGADVVGLDHRLIEHHADGRGALDATGRRHVDDADPHRFVGSVTAVATSGCDQDGAKQGAAAAGSQRLTTDHRDPAGPGTLEAAPFARAAGSRPGPRWRKPVRT